MKDCGSAVIWVTHDTDQPKRVGGRILELPFGTHSTVEASLLDLETDSQPNIASPKSLPGASTSAAAGSSLPPLAEVSHHTKQRIK